MTASICQRVPLAASDERVVGRHCAARHDRAVAAAGVLPPKPRHAGCGLISLPRLSAHDHDDVSVPARRCKPIRERAGNLALGGPQAAAVRPVLPVIGLLTWSRRMTTPGTPSLALGRP